MRWILSLVAGLALFLAVGPVEAQPQGDSTYTVQSGDTLFNIAREYGVSVEALKQWNEVDGASLQIGQKLRVRPPSSPPVQKASPIDSDTTAKRRRRSGPNAVADGSDENESELPFGRHTVETGDTFVGLSLRLGTTADTLLALNDSASSPLSVGTPLRLPRRFGPPTHVVADGETLYSIAGQYGVSVRSLQAANDLDTTALTPDQILRLPSRSDAMRPPGQWTAPDSTGPASVYPDAFTGRLMASGRAYDPDAFLVSHPSLPFGSVVLISRPAKNLHTFAHVQDRGPAQKNRFLNLSDAVAQHLNAEEDTAPTVALRVVWRAK